MNLIYLSPVPWESFAQRPHKFVEWFHRRTGGKVLWVDPYPSRFPNWRDLRLSRFKMFSVRHTKVPPWLEILKPRGIPIEPLPYSELVNSLLWKKHFSSLERFSQTNETLLVIGKPSVFALEMLKILKNCKSLYDAMDDFPAFYKGFSRLAFMRREQQVASQVKTMWVSSTELGHRWANVRDNVHLVRNGLDHTMLDIDTFSTPHSPNSKKKVLGYVGTIASWFDWDWIVFLAQTRKMDEIRLIGPVYERPIGRLPSNINLLPACDHAGALRAMREFDIGLIPFKKNLLTASVDPIKYYEYRALGIPVISTDFGEMSGRFGEASVCVTKSKSDIPWAVDELLRLNLAKMDTDLFIKENSWDARFDKAKLF